MREKEIKFKAPMLEVLKYCILYNDASFISVAVRVKNALIQGFSIGVF
jgi:hypothetical protein